MITSGYVAGALGFSVRATSARLRGYTRRVVDPGVRPMTSASWLFRRFLPCLLLVAAGTVAVGLVRGLVLYVPGILGMAAGGLLGWLCGRIGRSDPEDLWSFENRVWLALGAALLYAVGTAATVSVLRAGLMGAPLEWLVDVVHGSEGELFAGHSTNSFQSVSGTLHGAWWLVFGAVDTLLFAFLFLVLTMVGVFSDPQAEEADGEGEAARAEIESDSSPPTPIDQPSLRAGRLGFAGFAAATAAVLLGLHFAPVLATSAASGRTPDEIYQGLQGEWQLDEAASFLGAAPEERRFTLSRVFTDELAGIPADPPHFMLTLKRRPDGIFEGRLMVRGADVLPVRMRPSEDLNTLELVVDWWGPGGRSERRLTARRLPGAG